MEYTTIQKNITTSPRKLRLVADMVRKMSPEQAVEILQFTNKAAAQPLIKAIKTVLANSKKADVVFKTIEINEGPKLKRYRVGTAGRGRGRPYRRRWSHIKIVLIDDLNVKSQMSKVKSTVQNAKVEDKKAALKEKGREGKKSVRTPEVDPSTRYARSG
ncbi:hypothetical protein HYW46_04205 [Candidatus Daviesbacteria bacterium]|nr:hypothetical protein [Candidatus Daviesbacteria bacterium]